jgi:hypothetical protein
LLGIPVLVALVLATPGFFLPFLWDDFDFLGRTQVLTADELTPDRETLYYRPLSRELYFSLIHLLGASPFWGHVLNAAALAGTILFLFWVVRHLVGPRAALYASLMFAVMGAHPVLVGWVSGSQDVLAMFFTMGAIVAQLRARTCLAVALYICALLSKETAAAMLPAILIASYLGFHRRKPMAILTYILVSVLWLPSILLRDFSLPGRLGMRRCSRCGPWALLRLLLERLSQSGTFPLESEASAS